MTLAEQEVMTFNITCQRGNIINIELTMEAVKVTTLSLEDELDELLVT